MLWYRYRNQILNGAIPLPPKPLRFFSTPFSVTTFQTPRPWKGLTVLYEHSCAFPGGPMVLGSSPASCFGELARRTHIIVLMEICHRGAQMVRVGSLPGSVGRCFMSLLHGATQSSLSPSKGNGVPVRYHFCPRKPLDAQCLRSERHQKNSRPLGGKVGSVNHTSMQSWNCEQPLCQ